MHKILNNLAEYNESIIFKFVDEYPEVMYHYTDGNGAIGLLSNNKIWATNIGYLNDHSEFNYSKEIILKCISQLINKVHDQRVLFVLRSLLSKIEDYDNTQTNFFVSCFCEQGDLLSQWRAYGSNGSGYSLGFYPSLIGKSFISDSVMFDHRPIIYDIKKQEELIIEFLNSLTKEITESSSSKVEIEDSDLIQDIIFHLLEYMLMFKHPSFSEEKEWRIIYIPEIEDVKFRSQNNIVIPYVEIDLSLIDMNNKPHLPIKSILIGPTSDSQRAKGAIEWLCRKYHHDDCEISTSEIPLIN